VLLVGVLAALLGGSFLLAGTLRGVERRGEVQRAADLAALAGARAMHAAYPRLYEPAVLDGRPNPRHLTKAAYLELGRAAAADTARRNAATAEISFPDGDTFGPVRVEVRATREFRVRNERVEISGTAEAELAPTGADGLPAFAEGGGYDGPLAYRHGKPMRPDVAMAFDRMAAAARADGVGLIVVSGFRSDAEQAVLFARHPDPRWVAPPGRSLHRYGTELDLGPRSAYGWLAANAKRFGFIQRYSWEAWHYGFIHNARSTRREPATAAASGAARSDGARDARGGDGRAGQEGSGGGAARTGDGAASGAARSGGDGATSRAIPGFVPARFAPLLSRASQRWNVSATLLAAQIHAESGFNPFAVSPAGAQGIAQFMPGTARAYGLRNPLDPAQAIDAQAHHMRDLLKRFGSVALALAAYNAGPARVAACGCVPPIPETRGYVARILGLMGGAGEIGAGSALAVRLVA
jgi:hypothetical protein